MTQTTTTSTATASISDEFDMESDPRVAQGIRDLGYSGYTRGAFRNAMKAGSSESSRVPSDSPKPSGAFGS